MLTFHHLKLVHRQPREMKRLRKWMLEVRPGELSEARVLHEDDGSCCRREPWNVTLAAIRHALHPPTGTLALNLDHRPEGGPSLGR